jgi:spore coat polysaccharide biosynthesis protein SpsF
MIDPARVVIVVQARMSSTRLPGKVLLPLAGAPALLRMMERVARVRGAARRLVATSTAAADDAIVQTCRSAGVPVVRGPLEDVLARFALAVPPDCEAVVRLTADCPLVDAALVDQHIAVYAREQPHADYVTNAALRTQPNGLDVEVVSRAMLMRAAREASAAYDREHVLSWVARHARMVPVRQSVDLSDLRWTLDTAEDYAAIAAIYEALYPGQPDFSSGEVYRLLRARPELVRLEPGARREDILGRIDAHLERAAVNP